MTAGACFVASGRLRPLPGPGFSTPTFQRDSDNGLWIQDINDSDIVVNFLELGPRLLDRSEPITSHRVQRVGGKALYWFDGIERHHIGTRSELEDGLRAEYDLLGEHPRLRRTIGRFVNDDALIRRAEADIQARALGAIGGRRRADHAVVSFVHRPIFDEVLRDARRGLTVLISGRRGSGKTALLHWLDRELDRSERRPLRIHGQTGDGLLVALARAADDGEGATLARDAIRNWIGGGSTRQEAMEAATDRVLLQFMEMCSQSARPMTLLLDDIHIFLAEPARSAATALLNLARIDLVGLVLADSLAGLSELQELSSASFLEGHDYRRYDLPDLNAQEIDEWLVSRPSSRDVWPPATQRSSLARKLSGLNFRELADIMLRLIEQGSFDERSTRSALEAQAEQSLSYLRREGNVEVVLVAIAQALNGADKAAVQRLIEENEDFRRGLVLLVNAGMVELKSQRELSFRHTHLRDWWMHRHPIG